MLSNPNPYTAVLEDVRLPVFQPGVYPGSRLNEAAGNDAGGCHVRIVSFRAGGPVDKVIDYYFTRATAAGYDADHKRDGAQHVLGGTQGAAAYIVYATARRDGGTDVDLIVKGG